MPKGRLTTIKPRVVQANTSRLATAPTASESRIAGTTNQNRRWRLWQADPHCAHCGRLVDYPGGFELDHIVPLHQGGYDGEPNLQVLCIYFDAMGAKKGCHMDKTLADGTIR
jgi:5-methylcytosine-specific restriction endonuclease McrA